jgi:hypothetical protein
MSPTIVKDPKREQCQLCGKEVALLPNGKLRYHSCQPQPLPEKEAEPVAAASTPVPTDQPVPPEPDDDDQPEAPDAPGAGEESQDDDPDAGEESQDDESGEESQEPAEEEITLAGRTVEDAAPAKPKAERKPKEPKVPTEPKVPESVLKARAERQAMIDRAKPMTKLNGTGDNVRVTLHMYDPEADRTLCGAVVPGNEEAQHAQGWYLDGAPVSKEQADAATSCNTCQARMAKLNAGGSIRRRVARKPGDVEIGTPVVKGSKDGTGQVHLTNAASSNPVRTLCGAIIGTEQDGWIPAEDPGVEVGCPTCRAREAKIVAAQETDAAVAEASEAAAA